MVIFVYSSLNVSNTVARKDSLRFVVYNLNTDFYMRGFNHGKDFILSRHHQML